MLQQNEENEDRLRDSLSHANREREELLERLSYFQNKVKHQQEEVRYVYTIIKPQNTFNIIIQSISNQV